MSQVGCFRAWAGVTSASCWRLKPLKGPPEAVKINFLTSSLEPDLRLCASAECSESTGTICPGAARSVTSLPPTINDSLLASASVLPLFKVFSVAKSPAEPVMPLTTTSALLSRTSSAASSEPSAQTLSLSPNSLRWASRSSPLRKAERPTSSNRSGLALITSKAWVPMEPVDPRTKTFRISQNSSAIGEPLPRLVGLNFSHEP